MIRGQWQLQKLTVYHCRTQGSSRGVREFIDTRLPAFAAANPQLNIQTVHRNCRHPYIQAEYASGIVKEVDVKNEDAAHIASVCHSLRCQSGRVLSRKWPHPRTSTPSLQGVWNPAFNYVPPVEQMKAAVERATRMVGVAPPLSAAATVPPPPSLRASNAPSPSTSSPPLPSRSSQARFPPSSSAAPHSAAREARQERPPSASA